MLRRVTLALILLASAGGPSAAQERFPQFPTRPNAWTSLSIGLFQLQDMYDPESNSAWDFGTIVQFRGSLERDFQRGTSVGVAASLARAPLSYAGPDCTFCDADVTLWQVLALFRIGGGRSVGLHQVIEIGAGVTGFSGFRQRGGDEIGPGTVVDPTFSIGYGLGYSLSPNTQFTLLQEVGLMIHRRGDRPAGDESNVPRTYSTRIGLRFGLGGWR
jgi:hypothetical protein